MANGNGPAASGGTWMDQAARVITQVGFPVAAAALLLWYVLFRFGEQVDSISFRLENNAAAVERVANQSERQLGELQRQTAALEEIARYAREREKRTAP